MIELPFDQTFVSGDLAVVGLLVMLEGVLSIDNALVLGLLARRLPKPLRSRALTYGLAGAFAFRLLAIASAQYLLKWRIVKLLGSLYLMYYVAAKYFVIEARIPEREQISLGPEGEPVLVDVDTGQRLPPAEAEEEVQARMPVPAFDASPPAVSPRQVGFWSTVAAVELTDIAFAVDSILAAIALVGGQPRPSGLHPKLWVVMTGGMLGVILMRFAAVLFIRLLERFPRFEVSAYLLVAVIGGKLLVDWAVAQSARWHKAINFHDPASVAFWVFWLLMLVSLSVGFIPKQGQLAGETVPG